MGGPYKRKKYHYGDTHLKKGWRTKRRTKDLDQIDSDLQPDKVTTYLDRDIDLEKPGLGQFYCVHCAKDFINTNAFNDHVKSKKHKRRLHALKTEPYTIEESLRAAGMGSYHLAKKRAMETALPKAMKDPEATQEKIETVLKGAAKRKRTDKEEEEDVETTAKRVKVDADGDQVM